MHKVFQTKLGKPHGNCFEAAVASVLEIPLEDVPDNFGTDDQWFVRFRRWCISTHALEPFMYRDLEHKPAGLHLMGGLSPRGIYHSVVGFMGEMEHDPHPSGDGLREVETYTVFALLDPRIVKENDGSDKAGQACDGPNCEHNVLSLQLVGVAIEHSGRVFCCDACSEEWMDKAQDETAIPKIDNWGRPGLHGERFHTGKVRRKQEIEPLGGGG